MSNEKKEAIALAMAQIEKQFGKGSVMRLGESAHYNVDSIPTGALSLDIALGIGGVPKGRIIEIFGPESSEADAPGPKFPAHVHLRVFGIPTPPGPGQGWEMYLLLRQGN